MYSTCIPHLNSLHMISFLPQGFLRPSECAGGRPRGLRSNRLPIHAPVVNMSSYTGEVRDGLSKEPKRKLPSTTALAKADSAVLYRLEQYKWVLWALRKATSCS